MSSSTSTHWKDNRSMYSPLSFVYYLPLLTMLNKDAPGFHVEDLYHMKVLRECLLQECHALVHVVNNKGIPADCKEVLRAAGMLSVTALVALITLLGFR